MLLLSLAGDELLHLDRYQLWTRSQIKQSEFVLSQFVHAGKKIEETTEAVRYCHNPQWGTADRLSGKASTTACIELNSSSDIMDTLDNLLNGTLDLPYPAATKQVAGLVNGVKTDVMVMKFSDKIMVTISQEGRLAHWVCQGYQLHVCNY